MLRSVTFEEALPKLTAAVAAGGLLLNFWIWRHPRARLKTDLEVLKLARELDLPDARWIQRKVANGIEDVYGAGRLRTFVQQTFVLNTLLFIYTVVTALLAFRQNEFLSGAITTAYIPIYIGIVLMQFAFRRHEARYKMLHGILDELRTLSVDSLGSLKEVQTGFLKIQQRQRELAIEMAGVRAALVQNPARIGEIEHEVALLVEDSRALRALHEGDPSRPLEEQPQPIRAQARIAELEQQYLEVSKPLGWLGRVVDRDAR
jgi:hypothetical protein